jgi:8-oxo-dGTP diphosphatase
VLVAERPAGKPLAGFWEFPGGKLEPSEAAFAALKRELHEELGIEVGRAYRLLRFTHRYPEREVELDVWRVTQHTGVPESREGQRLAWQRSGSLLGMGLLPADLPIVRALELPPLLLVTPIPGERVEFLRGLRRSLAAGVDWVQLRAPGMDALSYAALAAEVVHACRTAGARVSLHGPLALALAHELRADGVHLGQGQLDIRASDRSGLRLGISCHSAEEMAQALAFKPDYLTLGPVQPTASHPGIAPMGWGRFRELAAGSPVPVYGIGGLKPADLETAQRHAAHGIAAIRSLWDLDHLSESS